VASIISAARGVKIGTKHTVKLSAQGRARESIDRKARRMFAPPHALEFNKNTYNVGVRPVFVVGILF
jgi:hypothetical protein